MRNQATCKYGLSLVKILQNFSVLFCLENSGILKEDIIDLKDLERLIKWNDKLFNNILAEDDLEFNLKQAKKAYNQVMSFFQIIKSHYNNVVANKKQFNMLVSFKEQLEDHIGMLEAMIS